MSRLIKILAMTLVLTAILVVSIAGTVFAAGGNPGNGNHGDVCPYDDCENEDCEPNEYAYNHDYNYATPGPHGAQNQWQKGKTAEEPE